MTIRGIELAENDIYLLGGKHLGPNRGFGAAHIWEEHAKEMAARGLHTYEDVPAYVASIVRNGTPLFFSAESFRQTKLMAVRAVAGTAILEMRDLREVQFWSVVTAYSGTKTHGTRVGTVR